MRSITAALWLAACASPGTKGADAPDGTLDACPAPLLVPGTGYDPVEPVAEGAEFRMVHGPQGGWHVDTGALVTFPTREVRVAPRLLLDERQIAGEQTPTYTVLADYDEETCTGNFYEVRAYVDDEFADLPVGTDLLHDYVCPLAGQALTVELEVSDIDRETVLTERVTGTLLLDPYDVSACAGGA